MVGRVAFLHLSIIAIPRISTRIVNPCREKRHSFLNFPYVCSEPVLVKCSFLFYKWRKSGVSRTKAPDCRPDKVAHVASYRHGRLRFALVGGVHAHRAHCKHARRQAAHTRRQTDKRVSDGTTTCSGNKNYKRPVATKLNTTKRSSPPTPHP